MILGIHRFWRRYPDSKSPLSRWYKIMQKNDFASFNALRNTIPTADKVGDLVVFNIGGNKYRLIAAIHLNRYGVLSEILNGKRELNVRQIRALARRFNVSPAVFI